MNQEIAKAAIQFMLRVQLQGQEVPAFNAVMESLHEIVRDQAQAARLVDASN